MTLRTKLSFIVLLAASLNSFGQGFQGGLRGAVRDTGGALVPGVQVVLTNEATSLARTTVTNDAGEYSFAALDPGSYRLHASLTGFKALDLTGIRVGTAIRHARFEAGSGCGGGDRRRHGGSSADRNLQRVDG